MKLRRESDRPKARTEQFATTEAKLDRLLERLEAAITQTELDEEADDRKR